jgi:DNA-binding transcriptional ArsR family regulator
MAPRSAFPVREEVECEPSSEAVALDDAGDVVSALTSETARKLVDHVYTEPATASELADAIDTSLQNAQYHLNQLEDAGVVEVVGTWYSKRGTDMDVYGPTNEPLVIVAGPIDDEAAVEAAVADSATGAETRAAAEQRDDDERPAVALGADGGPESTVVPDQP